MANHLGIHFFTHALQINFSLHCFADLVGFSIAYYSFPHTLRNAIGRILLIPYHSHKTQTSHWSVLQGDHNTKSHEGAYWLHLPSVRYHWEARTLAQPDLYLFPILSER